jgi:ferritin-like metal-binding protein YciE
MNLDGLRDVFHDQLKDMYSAEKQLTEALPTLAQAASSQPLRQAFEHHLEVTRQQLEMVGRILSQMGINPGNKVCKAMQGLVEEGSEMASKGGDKDARDAGLVAAAQKVEHYEIASYGSLRTWAQILGEREIAETLQMILDQEYEADNQLDQIAESYVNQQAAR